MPMKVSWLRTPEEIRKLPEFKHGDRVCLSKKWGEAYVYEVQNISYIASTRRFYHVALIPPDLEDASNATLDSFWRLKGIRENNRVVGLNAVAVGLLCEDQISSWKRKEEFE